MRNRVPARTERQAVGTTCQARRPLWIPVKLRHSAVTSCLLSIRDYVDGAGNCAYVQIAGAWRTSGLADRFAVRLHAEGGPGVTGDLACIGAGVLTGFKRTKAKPTIHIGA